MLAARPAAAAAVDLEQGLNALLPQARAHALPHFPASRKHCLLGSWEGGGRGVERVAGGGLGGGLTGKGGRGQAGGGGGGGG